MNMLIYFSALSISQQEAGKSLGTLEVIIFPSRTTGSSTYAAPALIHHPL